MRPADSSVSAVEHTVLLTGFLLEGRCPLIDQMSFVLTFPRRGFILAKGDGHGANENEIAIFVFGVTTKDFPHDMLLQRRPKTQSAAHHRAARSECPGRLTANGGETARLSTGSPILPRHISVPRQWGQSPAPAAWDHYPASEAAGRDRCALTGGEADITI
jgi:hypothetical protein